MPPLRYRLLRDYLVAKVRFVTQTGSSLYPPPPLSASALVIEKSRTGLLGRVKPEVYHGFWLALPISPSFLFAHVFIWQAKSSDSL